MRNTESYLTYEIDCDPGTPYVGCKYSLLAPAVFTVRNTDGSVEKVGYGIGEIISVLQPRIRYLNVPHNKLKEIPLEDGSFITEWPDDLRAAVVWDEWRETV